MDKRTLLLVIGLILLGGLLIVRKASAIGIDYIKSIEQWSNTPYPDQAGFLTIGWGHKILPGENFTYINEDEGEQLLRKDLSETESAINRLVTVPITQNQYDALVSFVFNIGVSAFAGSTLLKKLNAGDYEGAALEFPRWRYVTVEGEKKESAGLLARRETEQNIFTA